MTARLAVGKLMNNLIASSAAWNYTLTARLAVWKGKVTAELLARLGDRDS